MYILQSLVLIPLLACSFAGYGLLLKQKLNLRGEFIPIVVLAAIACLVYFSGLVGLLAPGAILVMLGGVIAFALSLRRAIISGTSLFEVRLTFFGVGWTIGSLFFFSVLVRTHLVHYDNFSHWAIVVKQMLSTNAFPTADSALIDFKNYPLGISSFLYYVCRFAGHWEPMMITAQGLLIFASLYAMFGIISEKKRFLLYAFLGLGTVSLSFFNLTIRINNLLVDFLLPDLHAGNLRHRLPVSARSPAGFPRGPPHRGPPHRHQEHRHHLCGRRPDLLGILRIFPPRNAAARSSGTPSLRHRSGRPRSLPGMDPPHAPLV